MPIVKFIADRSVDIAVPQQPAPIQHYLRQPQRVINALVDPSRVRQTSDDEFCLMMRPLSFFGFNLQPTVYLRVWAEVNGTVRVISTHCEIRGIDYIDRRFSLQLSGKLSPYERYGNTYLQGRADLEVQVDLPPPLNFTPLAIVESAGNSLLKGILTTFKQRLGHQLIEDYITWANSGAHDDRSQSLPQPQAPNLG
jgi:hypothetical protein